MDHRNLNQQELLSEILTKVISVFYSYFYWIFFSSSFVVLLSDSTTITARHHQHFVDFALDAKSK